MYVYVIYGVQVFLILLLPVFIRQNTITNKARCVQIINLRWKIDKNFL